ncbi:MAG: hypothetical protein ACOZQL_32290 [Myxococcota bacterium]
MTRLVMLITALTFVACGGPSDGAACSKPSESTCAGATLFVCEGATWRGYPCPGTCTGSTCSWTNAMSGDACPQSAAGKGWCPLDGRQLSCFFSTSADAGVFVESACARCVKGGSNDGC